MAGVFGMQVIAKFNLPILRLVLISLILLCNHGLLGESRDEIPSYSSCHHLAYISSETVSYPNQAGGLSLKLWK